MRYDYTLTLTIIITQSQKFVKGVRVICEKINKRKYVEKY